MSDSPDPDPEAETLDTLALSGMIALAADAEDAGDYWVAGALWCDVGLFVSSRRRYVVGLGDARLREQIERAKAKPAKPQMRSAISGAIII